MNDKLQRFYALWMGLPESQQTLIFSVLLLVC